MLRRVPGKKLSTQRTSCPCAINRSQRCEPRNPAPPVTSIFLTWPSLSLRATRFLPAGDLAFTWQPSCPRPSDGNISESVAAYFGRIEDVAKVDEDKGGHLLLDPFKIEGPESIPLGDDHQGIATFRAGVRVFGIVDTVKHFARPRSLRVVSGNLGAEIAQTGDEGERRRVPHVVGVRVKREAENRDALASDLTPACLYDPARHGALTLIVPRRSSRRGAGRGVILRRLDQSEGVLGDTRAAIARTGMQELAANPVVEPDAARDLLDVGADLLAEIGDLVDEGDLGRKKRVRGIFGQLGGAATRLQDRRVVQVKRPGEF